ncbi:type IA DNA topoisomerase [Chryseobacterium sp. SL1]|uniref:type IA DNA topoisomerase n=1 Tax=Chryseobacterium sp. SL1 TaxID=2995159 RepID=UPI00227518CC|nr:type IA DNA topoisomerase [Chryseobacterium sp. SL1]MCY1662641.1 DNA topoisomerase [Chryseobacterium sp. SL1]
MKLVIAEKPSVAREIANLLGAFEKKEGFLEGNGYYVTWALGHLIGLGMPEDYGVSGFHRDTVPLLPNPFVLTVRKIKKNKGYITDTGALRQLKIIGQLFKQCDSIVVATDAGREGELIFRYIYEYLDCRKPFQRLWISSLTEKAIRQGFDNLKPGSDYELLSEAAKGRSRADWLVGINASQALSIAAGSGTYSLGRVQTPTLALICKRCEDHKNFEVSNYWQISLQHRKDFIDFKSLSKAKWEDRKKAEEIFRSVGRSGMAAVTSMEIKTVVEQPPLLFDLTGLQKEANKKLGLSADETLTVAQNLYEKKFITYPRTGSRYIPEDQWPEIPNLVRALGESERFKEAVSKVRWGRFNKRIVNDLKVTDHHGLLVTERVPSALSSKENLIYEMIAFRLLESISHACSKEVTEVTLESGYHGFDVKGCKITEAGWRFIRGSFSDEEEPLQALPELAVGQELKIMESKLLEKKTRPPVLYTEAGLLSAMESAGRDIDNEEERNILKNIGIGTPATRAAIIETLFSRGYVRREKKSLVPTEKGMKVYDLVKDKKIADVSMTAEWEMSLYKIETGELDVTEFQKDIEGYAIAITAELLGSVIRTGDNPELKCPKCQKQHLIIRDHLVKCPDHLCNWVQFRNICGKQLDISDIEKLVTSGKTSLIKGMESKAGKKFDAYIVLKDSCETSFEFADHKTRGR